MFLPVAVFVFLGSDIKTGASNTKGVDGCV